MSRTKRLIFAGTMLLFSLLAIEGLARLIHVVRPLYEDKTFIYVDHERWHHWHAPNASAVSRARSGEFRVDVRTNRFGMPWGPVEEAKPPGVRRIALLGDSFVEGFTTDEPDGIAARLEAHLAGAAPPFDVLNFGCGSFSASLEYHLLDGLAERFDPDAVVLVFHATDVTDDWRYKPTEVRDAERDVVGLDGRQSKSGVYRVAEQSAVLRTFVQYLRAYQKHNELAGDGGEVFLTESFDAMFKSEYAAADLAAWAYTQGYIRRIKTWCDERGLPFLLVALPLGPQIEPLPEKTREQLRLLTSEELVTSTRMQDFLAAFCEAEAIPYVDLLPALRQAKISDPGELLFYPLDQHFTPRGNDVAAKVIADRLAALIGSG